MQGVYLPGVRLHVVAASGQPRLDQALRLSAQGAGHFVEADLGMVLYAPEHAAFEADLGGLHGGDAVAGKQYRPGWQGRDLVRVDGRRVV